MGPVERPHRVMMGFRKRFGATQVSNLDFSAVTIKLMRIVFLLLLFFFFNHIVPLNLFIFSFNFPVERSFAN